MAAMDMGDGSGRNSFRGSRGFNQGGFGQGGFNQGGSQRGGYGSYGGNNYRGRGSGGRPPRGGWGGQGYRGRGRGRGRGFDDPDDIKYIKTLKGHTSQITAVVINPASGEIYSGSYDGTIRVWDLESGQASKTIQAGARIDCMILEGPFLIAGLSLPASSTSSKAQVPASIRVWDIQTGQDSSLGALQGTILALAAAGNFLFAGCQDCSIKVWALNAETKGFSPVAHLTDQKGGHIDPVNQILCANGFLFSADFAGNIKVWDMQSGTCTQTVSKAHDQVIMSLVEYQGHVVTCGLEGEIKIWPIAENPAPGAVLETAPAFVHPQKDPGSHQERNGILKMMATADPNNATVLMASHLSEGRVRLWELPSFAERGHLNAIKDARAMAALPGRMIAVGDHHGTVKVWQWRTQ